MCTHVKMFSDEKALKCQAFTNDALINVGKIESISLYEQILPERVSIGNSCQSSLFTCLPSVVFVSNINNITKIYTRN